MRGVDRDGTVVLGITRRELDGIAAGSPCVFPTRPELGGGPLIVLWFAETDAALVARLKEMFPSGTIPFPRDLRTKRP